MAKRKTRLTGNTLHNDGDHSGLLFKIVFVILAVVGVLYAIGSEHQFRKTNDYRRIYSADVAPCSTPEDAEQCRRLAVPLNIEEDQPAETAAEATL